MLAYVFWHWPADDDDRLAAFHAALRARPPEGFVRSLSFRVSVPWTPAPVSYEDWYLVRDWAAIGALERAAVEGAPGDAHDAVARRSAGGMGAVYADRGGGAVDATVVTWRESGERGWQRSLVLGPAPEWCVSGDVGGGVRVARAPIAP